MSVGTTDSSDVSTDGLKWRPVPESILDGEESPVSETNEKIYQLSRGFQTYPSDVEISKTELYGKSAGAIALGFIPFSIAGIGILGFKAFAFTGSLLEKAEKETTSSVVKVIYKILGLINAIPGMVFAGLMVLGAKLFSLSQQVVWKDFVPMPSGDGINSRLAFYGYADQPWIDFNDIAKAFFCPETPNEESNEWALKEWYQVQP